MEEKLILIHKDLVEGLKRTMQGSYSRRAPSKKSIPFLNRAKINLENFLLDNSENEDAWRFLSLAEEALLNYDSALQSLNNAIKLSSKKSRKDILRRIQIIENGKLWDEIKILPSELEELGRFLELELEFTECDHTFKLTNKWIKNNQKMDGEIILKGFRNQGGFCDCEVLNNIVS